MTGVAFLKLVAWWNVFFVGLIVFGFLSLAAGGVWDTLWWAWSAAWLLVALMAQLAAPDDWP